MLTPITSSTVSLTVDNTAGGVALVSSAAKTAAVIAKITVFSQPIRYTKDTTAPTTTLGHYATDKDRIILLNQEEIQGFKGIREGGSSATLIVSYYEGDYTPEDIALLAAGF